MKRGYFDRRVILVVLTIELLAVFVGIKDVMDRRGFSGELLRPNVGEAEVSKELVLNTTGGQQEIEVNISPISRSDEEIEQLFDKAELEIENTVAGNNTDLEHVVVDLSLKEMYVDGLVSAAWRFDKTNIIDSGGKLLMENIEEETVVQAFCTLGCEGKEEIYSFYFKVIPPDVSTQAGFEYLLDKKLKETNDETKETGTFILPKSVGGVPLDWSEKISYRGIQLALFGLAAGIAVVISKKEQEKKDKKMRLRLLEADYPDIVSALSLYVGAGISVKSAVFRIADGYRQSLEKDGEKRLGYEGICMLQREIADGKGEIESYKAFGKRMGHKDYRKLSILLVQNIRKGTSQLTEMLEKEEHSAFEERKLRARIAGEEASTKLLMPMMGLLGIVLIVLIFPAMQGMNI